MDKSLTILIRKSQRIRDGLTNAEKIAGAILLAIFSITTFAEVLSRYLFNLPLGWTMELSRYSFIWLIMVTAPITIRYKENFAIDFLLNNIAVAYVLILDLIRIILIAAFSGILLVFGTKILTIIVDQTSPALGIPMIFAYAAIPVGGALMITETLFQIFTLGNRFWTLK